MISEIICVNHLQSLESHLKNKRRSFSLRHLFSTSTKISHSAIWQRGSCTPVNEGDCLLSFNQHLVSEKMENFPSSLCMFFQGLIVVRCRERLVIYVPTHYVLFWTDQLCANGVRNAPLRFVSHTVLQKQIAKHLNSIWKWLVKVSHNRPHPHHITSSGEVGWEVSRGDEEKTRSRQVWWLTGNGVGMLRSPMGDAKKGGGGVVQLHFNLVRPQSW